MANPECPAVMLAGAAAKLSEDVESLLAPLGIRMRHFRLLERIAQGGGQLQRSLGEELGVDRTTVVALVDHLEQLQLAKRCRCEDRRAYMVTITPKGERLRREAEVRLAKNDAKFFAALSAKERHTLGALLKKLR